jgi:hypothetical protein
MIDVSPVVPEARPPLLEAARVYVRHTRPWFVGLLVHGSGLTGGFIPGCSDLDLQLYLDETAFEPDGCLPLNLGLSLHRDLSRIDPAPFACLKCQAVRVRADGERDGGELKPIPGGYHLLLGKLPLPEATAAELIEAAHRALSTPEPAAAQAALGLLDHGAGRLEAHLRRLCTRVWPTLRHVLVTRTDRPFEVWRLRKDEAIAWLSEHELLGQQIRAFHRSVEAYYAGERTTERALAPLAHGVRFLREAREWYRRTLDR